MSALSNLVKAITKAGTENQKGYSPKSMQTTTKKTTTTTKPKTTTTKSTSSSSKSSSSKSSSSSSKSSSSSSKSSSSKKTTTKKSSTTNKTTTPKVTTPVEQPDLSHMYDITNSPYYSMYDTSDLYNMYQSNVSYLNGAEAADKSNAENEYNSNARAAYINYLKQKNMAGETLRDAGINGGASESAIMNIANAYARNQAANETSRINNAYEISRNYSGLRQDSYNNYQSQAYQAQQSAYQAALADMQRRQEQDKSDYASVVSGLARSSDGFKKLRNNLNPTDPNYQYKYDLLTGQVNTWALKEKEAKDKKKKK